MVVKREVYAVTGGMGEGKVVRRKEEDRCEVELLDRFSGRAIRKNFQSLG